MYDDVWMGNEDKGAATLASEQFDLKSSDSGQLIGSKYGKGANLGFQVQYALPFW